MRKTVQIMLLLTVCLLVLFGCGAQLDVTDDDSLADMMVDMVGGSGQARIVFSGDTAQVEGGGADVEDGYVRIWQAGQYVLSGEYNGRVEIDTEGSVLLALDGVQIHSDTGPAIWVRSAELVTLDTLAPYEGKACVFETTAAYAPGEDDPKAAIYSESELLLCGETIEVIAAGELDGINSEGSIRVTALDLTIAAGDKGIHSDRTIKIESGSVNVTQCEEGLEAEVVDISGGEIRVCATDDGINCSGDLDTSDNYKILISGGNVYVDAQGDGLDSNGHIEISGGNVTVSIPADTDNAPLDFDKTCVVTGGTVTAAGSAMMAQTPSEGSTVPSIAAYCNGEAGAQVSLCTDDGTQIASFSPSNAFGWLMVASGDLAEGQTYTLYVGEQEIGSVVLEGSVTMIGEQFGGFGGMMPGGPGGPGGMPSAGMTPPEGEIPQGGMTMPDGEMPEGGMPPPQGGTPPDGTGQQPMPLPDEGGPA